MKKRVLAIHLPFSLLAALQFFVTCSLKAAAPEIDATNQYGIGPFDYNSTTHRIAWLSGQGICGGEVPSPATLSMNSPQMLLYAKNDTGMACNGNPEALTSDEAYVYFTQGGSLWRIAVGSAPSQAPDRLPLNNSRGFTPAAVALARTDLFWFESNGTSTKLWKSGGPGTNTQVLLLTGNYGPVHKMKVFYDFGAQFPLTCCFLGDDGRLWKVVLSPVGTPALMAANVRDFDMRVEESTSIFIPPFYRVFAMQDTQAWAIHLNNGSSQVIYPVGPPPSGKTLAAIAVDTNRVYLIEKFSVACGPFNCLNYNVLRQDRPVNDTTVRAWTAFGLATDNRIVNPHSLFATGPMGSYGSLLLWADGNTTRSLAADAPPISLNFRAMGLEIVQAVQNLDNSVPLVNGKRTYVRAYASADFNTTGQPKFLPQGILNVSQRFLPIQSFSPLGTLNPVQAAVVDTNTDLSVLRPSLKRSFLFELPRAWTQFPELQCEFVVNGNHAFTENSGFDPYGDNSVASSANFVSVQEHCWVFVAVKTVPDTYYPTVERNYSKFWEIIARAESMLPVDRVEIVTWPDLICPVFSTGDAKFDLMNEGDWKNARAALACWTIGRSLPCRCTRYIGTVSPNAGTNANISGIGGTRPFFPNSSVVRMEPNGASFDFPRGGLVMAHELGHNFGRDHVNCGNPASIDANYPYPPCAMSIPDLTSPSAHFGFDPIGLNVVNPYFTGDLMSYANRRWPSDYTWKAILFSGEFCFPFPSGGAQAQAMSLAAASTAQDAAIILVFAGAVDQTADRISLFPSFLVPDGVLNQTLHSAAGVGVNPSYTFRLIDSVGNVLNEGPLALEESDGKIPINTFVQSLTAPPGLAALQILHYGIVRAEHRMTPHAPSVSISQPTLDPLTHALQCDWTGVDLDGDRLAYTLQYSSDNGASWIPLQMANPNTSLRVDARDLAGGSQCMLRVIASDGLQCGIDTSDSFVIPNNSPVAVIVGLNEGDRLIFGQPLTITGIGHDLEDGMLSDAQLQWNISGPDSLSPSGDQVSLAPLSPGSYTAVLTVTDSAGASGSNTVHFEVLPLSVPEQPAPVLDGIVADDTYVDALEIPFLVGSQQSYARISHSAGYLNVGFSDLPFATFGSPISVGLVLDTNRTQHALPQPSEVGFYIDENGIPSQRNGDGSTMTLNTQPSLGVQSAFFRQGNAWSAELQIPESLIGGWGHEASVLINLRDQGNATAVVWPPNASLASPPSWAHALFGVTPASSNRPPIAIAQSLHVIRGVPGQVVTLDGTKSFDPDGQPITYQWTQVSGPAVSIQNATSASASFVVPNNNPALLKFRLVVNDGSLPSAPSDLDLATYSIALNPQPFPPIFTDSTSSADGAVGWPGIAGDRAVIDASQDLKVWIPIETNSVDADGLLHFRDLDSATHPWRFYRARGLSSTTTLVYSNNFQGPVGPEWSLTTTATTPVGARRFLGQFGRQDVTLTLNSLPTHTRLKGSCDLFIIGAWDGNVAARIGPDAWQLLVRGGAMLLDATFSSYTTQSYPGARSDSFPPRTNAAENDTLGYVTPGGGGADSVYHVEFTFDHQDPTLMLDFNGLGLVTSGDETWGVDNVVIESIYNP